MSIARRRSLPSPVPYHEKADQPPKLDHAGSVRYRCAVFHRPLFPPAQCKSRRYILRTPAATAADDHPAVTEFTNHHDECREVSMGTKRLQFTLLVLFTVASMLGVGFTGTAAAADLWVDEVLNMVNFEKAKSSGTDFDPYVAQLHKIRTAVEGGDQHIAKVETDRFLKMLQDRSHGINEVSADELYNFTQNVRPAESGPATAGMEIGMEHERPMSVPEHISQTPYEGGPPCRSETGCDYWMDDVYDPGAAG